MAKKPTDMTTLTDQAQSMVSPIADKLEDVKSAVVETMSDLVDHTSTFVSDAASKVPKFDKPAALLAGAAILGAVAGAIVPIAEFERARLKPIGAGLMKRMTDAGQEIADQSKAVVVETVTAAKKSASKHGKEAAERIGV